MAKKKKRYYSTIDCPICGNSINVRLDIKESQKCDYCRRPFILHKIIIGERVKGVEGEAIDFNDSKKLSD